MEDCPICLESLAFNGRKIHTTECNHKFHVTCFTRMRVSTCPCCRAPVALCKSKEKNIIEKLKKQENREFKLLVDSENDPSTTALWKVIQHSKITSIRASIDTALLDESLGNL